MELLIIIQIGIIISKFTNLIFQFNENDFHLYAINNIFYFEYIMLYINFFILKKRSICMIEKISTYFYIIYVKIVGINLLYYSNI